MSSDKTLLFDLGSIRHVKSAVNAKVTLEGLFISPHFKTYFSVASHVKI